MTTLNRMYALTGVLMLVVAAFSPVSIAEPSAEQTSDWASRRSQAQTLRQQADALKSEADATFANEEPLCYTEILTNRCREDARRKKVGAYQQAKKLDIEGRQLELAVRREEKAQKDVDFAAAAPEREFNVRQRADDTEKRNQAQREARENALEKRRQKIKESTHPQ